MLTDGTDDIAEWAKFILALVAVGGVIGTDHMVTTGIVMAVIRTVAFLADRTGGATGHTKTGLAMGTWLHR